MDEKESLLSTASKRNVAEAHRIQREQDRLPPVLKASSEYWSVKKKAEQYLRNKDMKQSNHFYVKAKAMLESHAKIDF